MRILHIVGSIDPAAGGPTEAIRMLIHYRPEGNEAEVATLDDPSELFLKRFDFTIHALGKGNKRQWYSMTLIAWLRANRHRFDGIILHGLWEFTSIAVLTTVAGHVPYLVFPHGMLDPYFKHRYPAKHMKKWIFWMLVQYWVLRSAKFVLFTASLERDLAPQTFWLWRWNPMVISYGADLPEHSLAALSDTFYASYPQFDDKRFLLFLGRIHPKKGCDLLLQAFAGLCSDVPDLHLVMAGPDANHWQAELQAMADASGCGSRVHWPGMLLGDVKWGAFATCEAFILPSHQENFGIAVVEALACGKPVLLSTQINIAPDIAADGCGLVEPDTLAGTRALLERWIALSSKERAEMSQRAINTFSVRYDMRENAKTILSSFNKKVV